ncbi:MAG: glycosyltransferase family 2 protein [Deltaproteobacteria bacterium]|nr:MAG: glycosyltransferase family 2 protein [Deltaproteobacteria bacterium]
MKLSIVIPVYNEETTIAEILRRVLGVSLPGLEREVVVVDDCSTDGTRELLADLPALVGELAAGAEIRVLLQSRNQGKGAALRRGFVEATGDLVLIQDADLEYDPADYPQLLAPLLDGRADVVYGSRFAGGQPHRVLYFWHYLGNKFLTLCSNALSNLNLTDMECCYKVFRRDVLQRIALRENRFGIEPELTAKVARLGCRIFEVGISYSGRTYAEGKKIGWKDGVRALWCILRYNLGR